MITTTKKSFLTPVRGIKNGETLCAVRHRHDITDACCLSRDTLSYWV